MRLRAVGVIAAFAAGLAIYDNYDKHTNFQPVDTRISEAAVSGCAVLSSRKRRPDCFAQLR